MLKQFSYALTLILAFVLVSGTVSAKSALGVSDDGAVIAADNDNLVFDTGSLSFRVPVRGSVNPSPLGEGSVTMEGWKIISEAVTRFGTVNTIWCGRRSTVIGFLVVMWDYVVENCSER